FAAPSEASVPVIAVPRRSLGAWLEQQKPERAAFVRAAGFQGDAGRVLPLPGPDGKLEAFLAGANGEDPLWAGALASSLPDAGAYRLEGEPGDLDRVALGWALGAYQYTAYKTPKRGPARLLVPGGPSAETVAAAEATYFVRDLVNAPAGDFGPPELEG